MPAYRVKWSNNRCQSTRLDQCIATDLGLSRDHAKQYVIAGAVTVNENTVTQPSLTVERGHVFSCCLNKPLNVVEHLQVDYSPHDQITCDDCRIPIVYEDDDILVINKPYRLIVHPAVGVKKPTLFEMLLAGGVIHKTDGAESLVHRLDQYTEGLMVIAKTRASHARLIDAFKQRCVEKWYYAVVQGRVNHDSGHIDKPIGRDRHVRVRQSCNAIVEGTLKPAETRYNVVYRGTNISLLDIQLITGRTHQIRVHCASMGMPVLGDALYSKQKIRDQGYLLQSYRIKFDHPIHGHTCDFILPVSDRLKKYQLRS